MADHQGKGARTAACGASTGGCGRRSGGAVAALLLLPFLAACTTTGQPTAGVPSGGATIAFESVDGPPEDVFNRLVQNMSTEAQARALPVISRQERSQYRVRAYLAAATSRKKTHFTWVWDIYDQDLRRTHRISGEETAGPPGRNPWAAADDAMLRKIARTGMEKVAQFLGTPGTARIADAATSTGPALQTVAAPAATDRPNAAETQASLAFAPPAD